jgi:hypothetical protein
MSIQRKSIWKHLSAGVVLFGSLGCGTGKNFTHDGDPLLGSFNRPITPTPPPTGSNIGNVWQGGPGMNQAPIIGTGSPPILSGAIGPLPPETGGANTTAPNYLPGPQSTNASMAGGNRGALATVRKIFNPNNVDLPPSVSQRVGPSIPLNNRFEEPKQPSPEPNWANPQDPKGTVLREPNSSSPVSGSAIVPEIIALPNQESIPSGSRIIASTQINTIEEGQQILGSLGVKWSRLEQIENGHWQYTCALSGSPNSSQVKQYSAHHPDQIQAMRAVVEQVQRDR